MRRFLAGSAAIAVAVLILALAEAALRSAGVGDPAPGVSKLRYQQVFLPILPRARRADGREVYRTTDPRLPYQAVAVEKDPRALRVVAFGGSALAGLGFSPNATLTRELERLLADALPDRLVEVVNLGLVALPSKKVRLLVEDVLRHDEPDVLVVYSGNNEFLELHSEKFARARSTPLGRLRAALLDTNLVRLVNPPREWESAAVPPSVRDLAEDEEQVVHARILEAIETTPEEVRRIEEEYEENLRAIAAAAKGAGVPLVLCTVAGNWEWLGREDLPHGWAVELVGEPPVDEDGWRRVVRELDRRIAVAPPEELFERLHARALAHRALGDEEAAAEDFRASMNADPHLRRATDSMAERVRRVAEEEGVVLADVVEALRAASPTGVVGFDFLYDYVHFTPEGAALAAAEVLRALREARVVTPREGFARDEALQRRLVELRALERDPLDVREWLGFGFDRAGIADRDLWKYERLLDELRRRVEADPADALALAYLGNASFFRVDGAAEAERLWEAALAAGGEPEPLRANLALLRAQHRPPPAPPRGDGP